MRRTVRTVCLLAAVAGLAVRAEECYDAEDASWAIKKWILTELSEGQKVRIRFYETELLAVRGEEGEVNMGPAWYIVSDGWQGAFYYEGGVAGEEREGAYLYPDYTTIITGVWRVTQ